jgi:hypothetical protein
MTALEHVRRDLEKDEMSQSAKYGCGEPTCSSARFHVTLPSSPQHTKFCFRPSPEQQTRSSKESVGIKEASPGLGDSTALTDSPLSKKSTGKVRERYDKRTLLQWFREMDQSDSGFVSTRGIIVFLRQRRVQAMRLKHDQSEETLAAQRTEVYRIRAATKTVDKDGKGNVNWDEFVEIFRQAGILLEYDSDRAADQALLSTQAGDALKEHLVLDRSAHRVGLDQQEGVSEELAEEVRKNMGVGKEHRFRLRRYGSACSDDVGQEQGNVN